ncbi:hypothetical protein QO004_000807 [Rhizobium mesoamericanum]|nr:hypothetical protein [Rhizobium mesoamericanum]
MSRERGRKNPILKVPDVRSLARFSSERELNDLFLSFDLAASALERPGRRDTEPRICGLCHDSEEEAVLYCVVTCDAGRSCVADMCNDA